MIIFYVIALIVYFVCPKYIQIIMLIANLFLPDAVPVLDELIMVAGLLVAPTN